MNIAIIGAGLSGLLAARKLQAQGHQVVIFEKSRGRGGRLCSKRLTWQTQALSIDIGAQYFTARDQRFKQEVSEWVSAGAAKVWDFSPHTFKQGQLSLSADDETRYVGTPAMNSIAHYLAVDADIRLQCRITRIEKSSKGWLLFDDRAICYQPFDWLFISAPAQQTFDLVNGHSKLADVIPTGSLKPCWALGVQTAETTDSNVQGIFSDDQVRWATKLSSRPDRNSSAEQWMLHFNPQWSAEQGKDIEEKLPLIGRQWLEKVFSKKLTVTDATSHYWAFASIAQDYQKPDCPWIDAEQQLSLMGDWTHSGRIEGACLSALNAHQDFNGIIHS